MKELFIYDHSAVLQVVLHRYAVILAVLLVTSYGRSHVVLIQLLCQILRHLGESVRSYKVRRHTSPYGNDIRSCRVRCNGGLDLVIIYIIRVVLDFHRIFRMFLLKLLCHRFVGFYPRFILVAPECQCRLSITLFSLVAAV